MSDKIKDSPHDRDNFVNTKSFKAQAPYALNVFSEECYNEIQSSSFKENETVQLSLISTPSC